MYTTTNLGLKKPEGEEFYDVQHMNDNMDVVDASVAEIQKSNDASIATMEKHINDTENPHGVTKEHVGLGEVPNVSTNDQAPTYTEASTLATLTSGEKLSVAFGKIKCAITRLIAHIADTTLHITANERATWNAKASTAVVSTSANGLCPKRGGTTTKFLRDDGTWAVPPNTTYSTANTSTAGLMTAAMVTKLNGIETGATKNTVDSALSTTSTNPVQNKVVSAAIEEINSNLEVIGQFTSKYGESTSVANDATPHTIQTVSLAAGTYVLVARVQIWATVDTDVQIALGDSFSRWKTSNTGENNMTIASIIRISSTTNAVVTLAHNDVAGTRACTSHLKAIRIA